MNAFWNTFYVKTVFNALIKETIIYHKNHPCLIKVLFKNINFGNSCHVILEASKLFEK